MKTIRHTAAVAATLSATLMLAGCDKLALTGAAAPKAEPASQLNQASLCTTSSWKVADGQCTPGQRVAFLPDSWGNEQLPIMFAALNCDLRYTVVHTNGGVVCIFHPAHAEKAAAPDNAASAK